MSNGSSHQVFFFFHTEDGIRDPLVTGVQTCALPIFARTGSYTVKGNENCSTPQPDLAISGSDITFSGLKGQGNDQAVVVLVHNLGTADASNVRVRFAVDGTQIGSVQTIGKIAAGSTGRASVIWDTHGQNGQHTLTSTADPANAIAESNEGNNAGSRTVTVQGSHVG